jgi:hypothetical protein
MLEGKRIVMATKLDSSLLLMQRHIDYNDRDMNLGPVSVNTSLR